LPGLFPHGPKQTQARLMCTALSRPARQFFFQTSLRKSVSGCRVRMFTLFDAFVIRCPTVSDL
ncbi:hypothetical protein T4A_3680, partial [Trichinella pseudospiralis]